MGPDVAKKRGDESKNYSPPIPPTRIPFLLTPEFIYVRFFEFSVFRFFGLLDPGPLQDPYKTAPTGCRIFKMLAAWRFGLGVQSCFLSAAPAASPKIHGVGNPWKILGTTMDKSRIFGNSYVAKKSRFENKLAVFRHVLTVF